MSEAYDSIKQGLEDALAHAKGKDAGARVHQVEVPEPNIVAARARITANGERIKNSIPAKPTLPLNVKRVPP